MSAKQDSVYTRTPAQLEQKQGLGKRFAEVIKVATDARTAAEDAQRSTVKLDESLTSEEVFNRLTENGELQGLFRGEDGELYINAEFIQVLEKLFAKDITMTGKFTHKASVFLEPDKEELDTIQQHIIGNAIIPTNRIPLYDFNNDGKISILDLSKCQQAVLGVSSLASWSGAVKTEVTMTIDMSNPDKLIHVTGTNMWGRAIDKYIGVNFTNIKNRDTEQKLDALSKDYIVDQGRVGGWIYRKWNSGTVECWGQLNATEHLDSSGSAEIASEVTTDWQRLTCNFPSGLFATTPIIIATAVDMGKGNVTCSDAGTTKDTCSIHIWGYSSALGKVNVSALGYM